MPGNTKLALGSLFPYETKIISTILTDSVEILFVQSAAEKARTVSNKLYVEYCTHAVDRSFELQWRNFVLDED